MKWYIINYIIYNRWFKYLHVWYLVKVDICCYKHQQWCGLSHKVLYTCDPLCSLRIICVAMGYSLLQLGENQLLYQSTIAALTRGRPWKKVCSGCKHNDVKDACLKFAMNVREMKLYIQHGVHVQYHVIKSCMLELRCVLLLALCVCCGGGWMLEQPESSCMFDYHRMQWLVGVTKVPWLYIRSLI